MPLPISEIKRLIKESIPDAIIEIKDLMGDNNHYSAKIKSSKFNNLSKIEQHKLVYKSLKVMVQKCGYEIDDVLRLKFNLLMPHPRYREGQYNVPHIDDTKWGLQDNQWNLIYYPEDSDGDTIFFNEKFDGSFIKDKELTIRDRVEPKNNTAVMFRGNLFHTSSNPIHSDWRIVLNANFTVK